MKVDQNSENRQEQPKQWKSKTLQRAEGWLKIFYCVLLRVMWLTGKYQIEN